MDLISAPLRPPVQGPVRPVLELHHHRIRCILLMEMAEPTLSSIVSNLVITIPSIV